MAGSTRRDFLKAAGVVTTAAVVWPASAGPPEPPESGVQALWASLTPAQRKAVCFPWDYVDPQRGLLRRRISANWQITSPVVKSDFFTPQQQRQVRAIFEGLLQPDWIARFDRQLHDDTGGFGVRQSIAIFGTPGEGPYQFALTGRHMTVRCDGGSEPRLAFGGPIFYGHAAHGFNEKPDHPDNVFWYQALEANRVFSMLAPAQQQRALVKKAPVESAVGFLRPPGQRPGIPIAELDANQRRQVEKLLQAVLAPYRQADRDRVFGCLQRQRGLGALSLAFYEQGDLGSDRVWDIWRLEGPSLVWHFRGTPHVHVWVHVADDPGIPLNA